MSDQEQSGGSLYFPFMAGFYAKFSDFGYPIIRFFTGLMMMPHGAQKLFGMFGGGGLDGTAGFFSKVGLEPSTVSIANVLPYKLVTLMRTMRLADNCYHRFKQRFVKEV